MCQCLIECLPSQRCCGGAGRRSMPAAQGADGSSDALAPLCRSVLPCSPLQVHCHAEVDSKL